MVLLFSATRHQQRTPLRGTESGVLDPHLGGLSTAHNFGTNRLSPSLLRRFKTSILDTHTVATAMIVRFPTKIHDCGSANQRGRRMDQRNSADPCDVLGKHCVFKATGMINYDEGSQSSLHQSRSASPVWRDHRREQLHDLKTQKNGRRSQDSKSSGVLNRRHSFLPGRITP
jgi:hypothetical protein